MVSNIIKRSLQKDGNILPEAYNILSNLPEKTLNYSEYSDLPPLDIYEVSLGRIIKSFLKLKENIIRLYNLQENPLEHLDEVLEYQKELLHAIQSHIDDCNRILKITSPVPNMENFNRKEKSKFERSVNYWLQSFNKYPYNYFEEKTRSYRTSTKIVNKIKHNYARLRLLSIEGYTKSFGYYVEGRVVEGDKIKLCPDEDIHPEYTAFSFSRDMAWNFYSIYQISHYLSEALSKSIKQNYDIEINPKSCEGCYLPELKDLASYIQDHNLNYFPDEFDKPVPLVSVEDSMEDTELIMKLDKEPFFLQHVDQQTVFIYHEVYSNVSHIIRPYVSYIQKRYNIKEFKVINDE